MDTVIQQKALGLYLHVPFCATACSFCAFYQERPQRQLLDEYLNTIELEIKRTPIDRYVKTIFWGGGTPGLLPAQDLERLGQALIAHLKHPPLEWTVEMAPSVVKADKLAVLKKMGVTRISLGVQTFNADLLHALGRRHGPNQVYEAYALIREAGFDHVNIDLMFALPGQSFEAWQADLAQAIQLNPEHLSTYCLTFEEDTALYAKLLRGQTHRRSLDEEADFYLQTWDILEEAGYAQYEISNFSRPSYPCEHNIDTWKMNEWIGIGPSAASQYQGYRYRNYADIQRWKNALLAGNWPREDIIALSNDLLALDTLIFGLRMTIGVNWNELQNHYHLLQHKKETFHTFWRNLQDEGCLTMDGDYIRLTRKGRLIADAIAEKLLDLADL